MTTITTQVQEQQQSQVQKFDAFVDKLRHHDWYYDYSDDHRVWRNGRASLEYIRAKAKENSLYETAFQIWYDYVYKTPTGQAKGPYMVQRDAQIQALRDSIKE